MFSVSSIYWDCGIELLNKISKVKICMITEDDIIKTRFYDSESYQFETTP